MTITGREKGLIGILVVVALIVAYTFISEDSSGIDMSSDTGSKTFNSRSINRYKNINPLPELNQEQKSIQFSSLNRNIFQYGRNLPKQKTTEEIELEQKQMQENRLREAELMKEMELKNTENTPIPPSIDFDIKGLLETVYSKAVVITKGPEIFVVREKETIFDQFIINQISRDYVEIGFVGFETVKEIPFKDTRGF